MMKGMMISPQEHSLMEENMSNLTSVSGDQTSVSSGLQAQEPPKKKRNLPGNPGYIPFTRLDFLDFLY